MPHAYPCDIPTFCRVRTGACRALNLFTRRGVWRADVQVLSSKAEIVHPGPILFYALRGPATVAGDRLAEGDAAITEGRVWAETGGFLYAALLTPG